MMDLHACIRQKDSHPKFSDLFLVLQPQHEESGHPSDVLSWTLTLKDLVRNICGKFASMHIWMEAVCKYRSEWQGLKSLDRDISMMWCLRRV